MLSDLLIRLRALFRRNALGEISFCPMMRLPESGQGRVQMMRFHQ
jgi:hypothetical protein